MATHHTKPVKEDQEAPKQKPQVKESVYPADELARAHKAFGTSYEIVAVALKLAGVKKATFTQAKEIVENFKNKEVK